MTKIGHEIASYYWISCKTPTKNTVEECSLKILVSIVKMDIVESCEITATVAPSAGWNCSGENTLCYRAWHRASIKLFELGVRTPGGLFLGVSLRYAGSVDFRRFRTPSLPIFGVILGLLETTKM